MNCPNCQQENREGAIFCDKCGAKLSPICSQCGSELRPQAQFCDKCGTALTTTDPKTSTLPQPSLERQFTKFQESLPSSLQEHLMTQEEGENRVLTIIFADLTGSVKQTAHLNPEEAAEVLNSVLKTMVDVLLKYEGRIHQLLGDGVLAYFGTPQTHENDPERAIRAALEIREEIGKLGLKGTVGINTGEVYLGGIGSEKYQEFGAMGPVVNLAARLQSKAQPEQIIVGEATYRHTHRMFEFSPLSLEIKGIDQPVQAYEVIRPLPRPEKIRGIEGLRAKLIGRDEELGKLKDAYHEVLQGRGQMASIIGEAGVGKSRLISELKEHIQENSATRNPNSEIVWLEGRCLELGMTASYWVFLDLFLAYFAWKPEDKESERAESIISHLREMVERGDLAEERYEEIGPLLGNLFSVKFGDDWDERLKNASPEQIRHQTFLAIHDFFVALSKRGPIVLIFEDLHWGDSLSLDLISLLMEALRLGPLFLVCVYRPEQEHKCWHLATIAGRKCPERYTELNLNDLTPNQSRRMIESLLTIDNLPDSVKELIMEKSRGNPFFVEEVVRSLIDSGMVYREDDYWRAGEGIESVAVPESVQSVILSRVDRLEEELKHVLRGASVIGRLFRRRVLARVTQEEVELESALWELEDHALIYQERTIPEKEYSFKHVLTQETVYGNILRRSRAEFHGRVGEAIKGLYQDGLDEYFEQLAYHYDRSGNVEKAVEYTLKAGEKSRRAYLNDEAIEYFQRVLEHLDESPLGESRKDWRLEALKGLGKTYERVGDLEKAAECFREAIDLGKEVNLAPGQLALLYHWLGDVKLFQGEYDEMVRVGEEGLAFLGDKLSSQEASVVDVVVISGYRHFHEKSEKMRREFANRYSPLIPSWPYLEELRPVYGMTANILAYNEKNVEEAEKLLQFAQGKAQENYDFRLLGDVYQHLGLSTLVVKGDLRGAIPYYERAIELFTKIGNKSGQNYTLGFLEQALILLGEVQRAKEIAYKNLEISEDLGNRIAIAGSYMRIGINSLCQEPALNRNSEGSEDELKDSLDESEDAFRKAAQIFQETGFLRGEGPATYTLGQVYLAQGKRGEAETYFEKATALIRPSVDDPSLRPFLADVLGGLEESYQDPEKFRVFCVRFREEHPEFSNSPFVQWFLEPIAEGELGIADLKKEIANLDELESEIQNPESQIPNSQWIWHDPFGDCSFTVGDGLEIHAPNGRDLWHLNLSAPRILRSVSGDFAARTVCLSTSEELPAIGGILLWKDKKNYLRLDKGIRGEHEISLEGCLENKDVINGRGRLISERVFLRLERIGNRVNALCSADGVEWFRVGGVETSLFADPIEVGLHAIGNIDRTIYHGAYPDGTAIRFEEFQLWGM